MLRHLLCRLGIHCLSLPYYYYSDHRMFRRACLYCTYYQDEYIGWVAKWKA